MLRVINVNAYYGFVHALKDISLEIPKGKIVTLLGANGAGKTSTLKAVSGLLKPAAGRITYEDRDITSLSADKIVELGIVQSPEGRQIFPEFSVYENLKIGTYARKNKVNIGKDFERVYGYFPILKQRSNQIAGTLSGGEQQMLAIARALMAEPKLLLLDEPSLGLAPLIVKEIFDIIKAINREGTTILLVEQNAYQALSIADFAYILETGRVTLYGDCADVRNDERVKMAYLGGH
ncbi:MAG: ABC transporter ATP-binding protein [Bacillota bacterium]